MLGEIYNKNGKMGIIVEEYPDGNPSTIMSLEDVETKCDWDTAILKYGKPYKFEENQWHIPRIEEWKRILSNNPNMKLTNVSYWSGSEYTDRGPATYINKNNVISKGFTYAWLITKAIGNKYVFTAVEKDVEIGVRLICSIDNNDINNESVMKKNTIKLNEMQLKKIVAESVKKVLKEYDSSPNSGYEAFMQLGERAAYYVMDLLSKEKTHYGKPDEDALFHIKSSFNDNLSVLMDIGDPDFGIKGYGIKNQ